MKFRILDTLPGTGYQAETAAYLEHMEPLVEVYPKVIERLGAAGMDLTYLKRYQTYMRWAIRSLEYSYVIREVLEANGEGGRVLDVGPGVTVLPHALARLGFTVDALDPASNWVFASKEGAGIVNEVYDVQVEYLNHAVFHLREADQYDHIISVSVLEHLPPQELKRTLEHLQSLLKPGGSLVMTIDYTPRASPLRSPRLERLARVGESVIKRFQKLPFAPELLAPGRGFSYNEFCSKIGPHLPEPIGQNHLDRLWKLDQHAHSPKEFWHAHAFDGCLYDTYRRYLSLAISAENDRSS